MSPTTRGLPKFCPNCGAKTIKDQKFCRECGADLQADATEQLSAPAPKAPAPPRASTSKGAAAKTRPLPPPLPPPARSAAPPPPPPPPPDRGDLDWKAWVAAGACGVLVIATGLPWFTGFISADSYDIPFALLFSDTAQGGLPFGFVFLIAAVAGLAVAGLKPEPRPLSIAFLSAGGAATFFMLWYLFKIMANLEGASLFDLFSIGAVLALLSSIGILVGGVLLRQRSSRAA